MLNELAAEVMAKQRKRRLDAHTRPWQPSATPATALGYRCERRTVYQRTRPEMSAPIGEELASIFEEGNLHQADVRRELSLLGFEVVEAELNFRDARLDITGTIDGKLSVNGEHRARRVPVEIKSCSGCPPTSSDGLRDHGGLYGRYFAQMQTYLFLTNEPEGLFVFKDKITGLWALVPVSLDFEYAENLLKRAERIRDHVKAGTLPDRIPDRSECDGCPFKDTVCHPAEAPVDPLLIAQDPELLSQLSEREQLDVSATRYDKIDKAVKERFKLTNGERFVVGDFLVEKKKHGKGIRVDICRLSKAA
jgi:hypothetical protein